jgi:parallel beta-helix repeat protein
MAWYDTKTAYTSPIASADWNAQADVISAHGYITVAQAEPANYVGSSEVAIQAAIDEAVTSGKRVLIKKGTYTINNTLIVNGHVQLYGEGSEQTILKAKSGLNANILESNSTKTASTHWRCYFAHLKFNNDQANQSGGSCVVLHGNVQTSFYKCHFENIYNYGIHMWDCEGGSGSYGHHNQVIDCLFDSSDSSGGEGIGIYMRHNDENTILGSQFQYVRIGLKLESGFNGVSNCSFVDGLQGIYILNSSRNRIENCVFDYCAEEGIECKGAFNIIHGNAFYRCSDGSSSYDFIYINWFGTNVITSNLFMSPNSTNKPRAAITEGGNASEDTYGYNVIDGNLIVSGDDTSLTSSNWTSGPIVETNATNEGTNMICVTGTRTWTAL